MPIRPVPEPLQLPCGLGRTVRASARPPVGGEAATSRRAGDGAGGVSAKEGGARDDER
jgi:hypothetical protein